MKPVKRDCRIENERGEVIFFASQIEAPDSWSQLAVEMATSKYMIKKSLGAGNAQGAVQMVETSVFQMVDRILRPFKNTGLSSRAIQDLRQLLLEQKASFNSPVWFNLGVFDRPQVSACFIQSVEDSLESIFQLMAQEAKIFQRGSGSGTNFSPLRGRDEPLASGGKSSGLMTFLEVFDRAAGALRSGGTTRRAAKMVCLDMDHPEVEDFITWKQREEEWARQRTSPGELVDFEGDIYRHLFGQNSNNSVRLTDAFMEAVRKDQDWQLKARVGGQVVKTLPARQLWRQLVKAAWDCADPGVQFHDHIQAGHTCPASGPIRASNPCAEYMFLDDSACNLASLNLVKFFSEGGEFLSKDFLAAVDLMLAAQDELVDLAGYPTEEIGANSLKFRPLGLGFSNLGGLLMRLGLPYDSEEGRSLAGALSSLLQAQSLWTSVKRAQALGPFPGYAVNADSVLRVMRRQGQISDERASQARSYGPLWALAQEIWQKALPELQLHGLRNAQLTAMAPTGTISFLMDCDTTGIEPDFALVKYKKMVGGGLQKMVNQSVAPALRRLGYSASQRQALLEYLLQEETLEGAPELKPEHLTVFDCAVRCGAQGQRYIAPLAHLQMMAAIQPFVSGALSKTINLPSEVTVKEVEEIFWRAWEMGLKAVAIYREGSKASTPLSTRQPSAAQLMEECNHCR